jgi:hypothetical protein
MSQLGGRKSLENISKLNDSTSLSNNNSQDNLNKHRLNMEQEKERRLISANAQREQKKADTIIDINADIDKISIDKRDKIAIAKKEVKVSDWFEQTRKLIAKHKITEDHQQRFNDIIRDLIEWGENQDLTQNEVREGVKFAMDFVKRERTDNIASEILDSLHDIKQERWSWKTKLVATCGVMSALATFTGAALGAAAYINSEHNKH